MSIFLMVVLSKLMLVSPMAWAEQPADENNKNVSAPYYCNGLELKEAKRSAQLGLRSYHFSGICSIRDLNSPSVVYKRAWLEIQGRWDENTSQATEVVNITAGGNGNLRLSLKCADDPWVSNAKCVVKEFNNQTNFQNFESRFKVRKKLSDSTFIASFPPLSRAITTKEQVQKIMIDDKSAIVDMKPSESKSKKATEAKITKVLSKQPILVNQSNQPESKTKIIVSNEPSKQVAANKSENTQVTSSKPKIIKVNQSNSKAKLVMMPVASNTTVSTQESKDIKVFNEPSYKGHRIAWCYHWGSQCGKIAADAWCQFNKFESAKQYKIAYNLGKTLVIGDNRLCMHRSCAGFQSIECQKKNENFAKR